MKAQWIHSRVIIHFRIAIITIIVCSACLVGSPIASEMTVEEPITMVSDQDGMVLVYVPEGKFKMGSRISKHERPVRMVYLDAFWIDRTEVTNAMFAAFVEDTAYQTRAEAEGWGWVYEGGSNKIHQRGADWLHPKGPSSSISGLEDHPVVQMSWEDANAYCEWAGRRLPTQEEWEKTARGTDGRKYPWGNEDAAGNLLNYADSSLDASWADQNVDDDYAFTAPVSSYPDGASPYGALDMAGNVREHVAGWYSEDYSAIENPQESSSRAYRMLRGGSWYDPELNVRSSIQFRGSSTPHLVSWYDYYGFRCAMSAAP